MANQHSADNQLVAYRLPRELVARVKAEVARTGEREKALVAQALEAELARRLAERRHHRSGPAHFSCRVIGPDDGRLPRPWLDPAFLL